jgi:hypothetical protein
VKAKFFVLVLSSPKNVISSGVTLGVTRAATFGSHFTLTANFGLLSMQGSVHTTFGRANAVRFSYLKVYGRL